jgi:hypothetical protein
MPSIDRDRVDGSNAASKTRADWAEVDGVKSLDHRFIPLDGSGRTFYRQETTGSKERQSLSTTTRATLHAVLPSVRQYGTSAELLGSQ